MMEIAAMKPGEPRLVQTTPGSVTHPAGAGCAPLPSASDRKRCASTMRISFDLDDTLILKTVEGHAEPCLPHLKRIYIEERLRRGTKDLMQALVSRGAHRFEL
jgi:hypothetical protein